MLIAYNNDVQLVVNDMHISNLILGNTTMQDKIDSLSSICQEQRDDRLFVYSKKDLLLNKQISWLEFVCESHLLIVTKHLFMLIIFVYIITNNNYPN